MHTHRKIFILVPALNPTGPIKGAYALANSFAKSRNVTLVTLKSSGNVHAPLDYRVKRVSLAEIEGGFSKRVSAYQALLRAAGGRRCSVSLSMCFSADLVNAFCRQEAVTCSSIRGNLFQNYRMDYGWLGIPLAAFHYGLSRCFDRTIAMTSAMARHVRMFALRKPDIVGNFVDEDALEPNRSRCQPKGPLRFVFLASMTPRKQPVLVIEAFKELLNRGVDAHLDMIGEGPLGSEAAARGAVLGVGERVSFRGQMSNPYPLLANADALVLPSLSEGLSRAALEALHLGVPCVLRDVDGNRDLVVTGRNGVLFTRNSDLAEGMLDAAKISRSKAFGVRDSLLPASYTQSYCLQQYLNVLENDNG